MKGKDASLIANEDLAIAGAGLVTRSETVVHVRRPLYIHVSIYQSIYIYIHIHAIKLKIGLGGF